MQLTRSTEEMEGALGRAVRLLRQEQRLTQVELAERANVSLSALKNLEHARGSSLTTLVRVARALGRTEWLEALAPSRSVFSPMEALRRESARTPLQRVRRERAR